MAATKSPAQTDCGTSSRSCVQTWLQIIRPRRRRCISLRRAGLPLIATAVRRFVQARHSARSSGRVEMRMNASDARRRCPSMSAAASQVASSASVRADCTGSHVPARVASSKAWYEALRARTTAERSANGDRLRPGLRPAVRLARAAFCPTRSADSASCSSK